MNGPKDAMLLGLQAMSRPDRRLPPYNSIFLKSFLVTNQFSPTEQYGSKVTLEEENVFVISREHDENGSDLIGVRDANLFYLLGLYEDKSKFSTDSWIHRYFEGLIPIQFSKASMYQIVSKDWPELELWEYRSGKSKVQSYFKDETVEKLNIKKRLVQDRELGLKPYFASYKVIGKPKSNFSFSVHGNGMITCSSEYIRSMVDEVSEIANELVNREIEFINFVRYVKLERIHPHIPAKASCARLELTYDFDWRNFAVKTKDDFKTNITELDSEVVEGAIYKHFDGEFVTFTAFPKAFYLVPRTLNVSRQENLIADITYAVDDLFGPLTT